MISIDLKDFKKVSKNLINEVEKDLRKSKKNVEDQESQTFKRLMVRFLEEKKGFVDKGHKSVKIRVKKGNIRTGKPFVFEVEKSKNLYPYTTSRKSRTGKSSKQNFGLHFVQRRLKHSKPYDFRVKKLGKKLDLFWSRKKEHFIPDTTSPSHVFVKDMPIFEKKVSKKMEELIERNFYS